MKATLLTLSLVILPIAGCNLGDLKQYNYRSELQPPLVADSDLALRFAKDLSAETGLPVTDKSPGKPGPDQRSSFGLSTEGPPRIVVNVATYERPNMLYILIYGDVESPEAKEAARKAEEVFAKQCPGSKLTRYTAHQTPFGP
jgi:hypothetical protein